MRTTKKLLELLTEQLPPFPDCKNAIVIHEDKLLIALAVGDPIATVPAFQRLIVNDEDLDRPAEDLVRDILDLLKAVAFDRDAHATHGRVTPEDTPNLSHCPCHAIASASAERILGLFQTKPRRRDRPGSGFYVVF